MTNEPTDTERLDFFDKQVRAYGTHYHEGNAWEIEGQFRNVRDAIDCLMKLEKPNDN